MMSSYLPISGLKHRFVLIPTLLAALFILVDVGVVDRWQLKGRLIDSDSGLPLQDALIAVDFFGEGPLLILPIPPHPPHRTSKCMGSKSLRTDEDGAFHFDVLTINRPLVEKTASFRVLKAGWLSVQDEGRIDSSTLSFARPFSIRIPKVHESMTTLVRYQEGDPRRSLPKEELKSSEELLRLLRGVKEPCGAATALFEIEVLYRSLDIAHTFEERERVRSKCLLAERHINNLKEEAARTRPDELDQVVEWPLDCSNLQFKLEPSLETKEMEARLASSRARARTKQ